MLHPCPQMQAELLGVQSFVSHSLDLQLYVRLNAFPDVSDQYITSVVFIKT